MHSTLPDISEFERSYLALRRREGWLLDDEALARLPQVDASNVNAAHWAVRAASASRLLRYLSKSGTPLRLLDVGCGNGWLTHLLASGGSVEATGLDINRTELAQARRVFGESASLQWFAGDLRQGVLGSERFDRIVFAASIQYFPSVDEILRAAFDHLAPGGEVHVLDSPFYPAREQGPARLRSERYFRRQGAEEMEGYYFHHSLESLHPFRYRLLYHPGSVFNRFLPRRNPFFWICIRPR